MAYRWKHPQSEKVEKVRPQPKKVDKVKFVRCMNKLRFLRSDLEYHQKELAHRKVEFDAHLLKFMKQHDFTFSTEKAENNYIPVDVQESLNKKREYSSNNMKGDCKKLFKEIVKETHPDKNIGKEERVRKAKQEIFSKCKAALDADDWYTLYDNALNFDIELPAPTNEQIDWLEKECLRIEGIIHRIQAAFEWSFGQPDMSDEQREGLLVKYCMLFCTKKDN